MEGERCLSPFSRVFAQNRVIVLFLVLLFAPRVMAAALEMMDVFSFSTASLAHVYQEQGRMLFSPFSPVDDWTWHADGVSDRVASPLLVVVLSDITGLSIQQVVYLPICGFSFILLAYAVAFAMTKSRVTSLCYAALQAADVNVITATNNLFYITLGYSILFLFLAFYLKHRASVQRQTSVVVLATYSVLVLSYYGAEFLGIVFAFSMFLFSVAMRERGRVGGTSTYLPLCLAALTVAFETTIYHYWTKVMNIGTAAAVITSYVEYYLELPFRAAGQVQEYTAGASAPPLLYISDLLYRLMLVACTLTYVILSVKSLRHKKGLDKSRELRSVAIYLAFIVAVVSYTLVYASVGLFNLRGFYLFFPLLALLSLRHVRRRHLVAATVRHLPAVLAMFLIVLVLFRFGMFFMDASHPFPANQYSATAPSLGFLVDHSSRDTVSKVVTSEEISGQLMYIATARDVQSVRSYWFGVDYGILYPSNSSAAAESLRTKGYAFLILSHEFERRPVSTGNWQDAPVAVDVVRTTSAIPALNLVYQDGNVLTFTVGG